MAPWKKKPQKKKKQKKKKKNEFYYAKNIHIFTMNEMEIAKDPNLDTIQKAVLEQHNSEAEESKQVVFVKFDKVEFVYACGGKFYFLSIGIKGSRTSEEDDGSIIEKMVWMGFSMEVLDCKNVDASSSTECKDPVGLFKNIVSLVISDATPDTLPLKLVGMHHYEEDMERHKDVPIQGGWFNFKVYNTIIEVKPEHDANLFIQSSVLCREWLQIMDDNKASSFSSWKALMLKAHRHPSQRASKNCAYPFYPLDMCSPQVVTQVWHAIEDHNYKKGTNLEFVQVLRGEWGMSAGRYYYLTFQAKDSGVVTTFQFAVYANTMIKCWRLIAPLKPCKMKDGYEIPDREEVWMGK